MNNINKNQDYNSDNIFDEFSNSEKIVDELQQIESNKNKDVYFYLQKGGKILFILNSLLLLFCIIGYSYNTIQKLDSGKVFGFLDPICVIFVGSTELVGETCPNIYSLYEEKKNVLDQEIETQSLQILPLVSSVYAIENFNFSPRVKFLLDISQNRGQVLSLLAAFDDIKMKFSPIDKKEVSCYNISITRENIFQIRCDFFSSDWDTSIKSVQGGERNSYFGGTSISKARSFIDFLKNDESARFIVLDSSNSFVADDIQDGPYTQKTTIQLELLYQGENIFY